MAIRILGCAAALLMLPASLLGDTVEARFYSGGYPGTLRGTSATGSFYAYSGAYQLGLRNGTGIGTQYDSDGEGNNDTSRTDVSYSGQSSDADWLVFCIELKEYSSSQWLTYDIIDPELAPRPATAQQPALGNFGQTAMQLLFGQYYGEIAGNATNELAFQASVWEIAHELDWTTDGLSVTAGDFQVTGGTSTSSVQSIADGWLSWVFGEVQNTSADSVLADVKALSYDGSGRLAQDYLFWDGSTVPRTSPAPIPSQPVPEPGTLVGLVGMALALAGGNLWRRRRRS
jgi:hypothetical protein